MQNNLIESASHATGSLMIWDVGEYEVLPPVDKKAPQTDEEDSDDDDSTSLGNGSVSDSEWLFRGFQKVCSPASSL